MEQKSEDRQLKVTVLPELTFDNLESIMAERIKMTKTDKTTVPMLWQGMLEQRLTVAGELRTVKMYVPENTPQGAEFVIMNIPDGEQTIDFLEQSGWTQKADEEGVCLFVLEPGKDGWKSHSDEEAYVSAAFRLEAQGIHCLPSFAAYVVGYGKIGSLLHEQVMANPLQIASAVFMDASEIDEQVLCFYQTENLNKQRLLGKEYIRDYNVPYRNIPVPVWIVSEAMTDSEKQVAEYWKNASHTGEPKRDERYGDVFLQEKYSAFTPEGKILQVITQKKKYDYSAKETTDRIYEFLKQYYRYGMGPCSNMISRKLDYKKKRIEHRRFTDTNGIEREYLVYLPENYRSTGKKYPIVFTFHGASQSMRNMLENGLWYEIADQNDIIVVSPESTLNPLPEMLHCGAAIAYRPLWQLFRTEYRWTDRIYIEELLDRVVDEYPVDESCVYATGHSMGCMLVNYLGSSKVSDRFAALSGTCGIVNGREYTGENKVPVFLTMGEYDIWDYRLSEEGDISDTLDMWLIRNQLAVDENVKDVRRNQASQTFCEKRYHNYVWKDQDGTPWLRYAWVEKRDHMYSPEENRMFWEQWFRRWHIDSDGNRKYVGDDPNGLEEK